MPDSDFNVTDAIFDRALRAPHAVALIEQGRSISYGALCRAVRHAMQSIHETGWRAGDVIGISLHGKFALQLIASLALARLGATQVVIPPGDTTARRAAMVRALGVKGVIISPGDKPPVALPFLRLHDNWHSASSREAITVDLRAGGRDKTWIICQSSGTTGDPKHVPVTHSHYAIWVERLSPLFDHLPGERFMNMIGLRFWVGTWRAMACLSQGGTLVALPESPHRDQVLDLIDMYNVAYLQTTPFHLHWLLEQPGDNAIRLPNLRILRCGSAGLDPMLLQQVRQRLSPKFFYNYGANETGPLTAATPDIIDKYPDSVGTPLPGVEFEIVDAHDRSVPTGTVGRVRVRCSSESVMAASTVLQNDWIYPGDTALRNEEGVIFLKGRDDEIMNFDGILISPVEIESALTRHPMVDEAAAFSLPSPQHQDVPAIALVLKQAIPQDELNRYCIQNLGVRAPRIFIVVDSLPRNDRGKVLRRRLTEIALERLGDRETPQGESGFRP